MKKIFLIVPMLLLAASYSGAGEAIPPAIEKVLKVTNKVVKATLNKETVKCSNAGYENPELKVLVADLAPITLMNHRNPGEGAPCVRAGVCEGTFGPNTILSAGEGTISVPVTIRLIQVLQAYPEQQVCNVTLVETINSTIRGVKFDHRREINAGERELADCK
jgi:hypothetical protein